MIHCFGNLWDNRNKPLCACVKRKGLFIFLWLAVVELRYFRVICDNPVKINVCKYYYKDFLSYSE